MRVTSGKLGGGGAGVPATRSNQAESTVTGVPGLAGWKVLGANVWVK
jgi:hypothetical protein